MRITWVFAVVVASIASVWATTVMPPSFDELVQRSELIVRGRVVDVRSGWAGGEAKPHIATWVTIAIERTLRGSAGTTLTLEFVGGSVGDRELVLAGWPRFVAGERGIFFVENRRARLCPLVRLRHGRYRVVSSESAVADSVLRDDHTPLRAVAEVDQPLAERTTPLRAGSPVGAIQLAEFEMQIIARSAMLPFLEAAAR